MDDGDAVIEALKDIHRYISLWSFGRWMAWNGAEWVIVSEKSADDDTNRVLYRGQSIEEALEILMDGLRP